MDTEFARRQMVDQQVRAWEVFDPAVLAVMERLPREHFVPPGLAGVAYGDTEIPLGHGESMMTPTVEGRLLQALELEADDTVLEIGTGSGYLTACLANLAAGVTSLDIHGDFVADAERKLEALEIHNVAVHQMDAMAELPDDQYDAIAVTGSLPVLDTRFVELLKPEGRMFIVTGQAPVMTAQLITRGDGAAWQAEGLFETELKMLINAKVPEPFTF